MKGFGTKKVETTLVSYSAQSEELLEKIDLVWQLAKKIEGSSEMAASLVKICTRITDETMTGGKECSQLILESRDNVSSLLKYLNMNEKVLEGDELYCAIVKVFNLRTKPLVTPIKFGSHTAKEQPPSEQQESLGDW